jgi:hypothetical protein
LFCYEAKRPNLMLKTRAKQLLGFLPLAFALAVYTLFFVLLEPKITNLNSPNH